MFCNDASAQLVLESYGQENDIAFVVKGGKLSLAKADLEPFTGQCGFIPLYLQAKELDKRLRYLDKMNQERLHPKYNILATTGRVYAHGDLAIQSLPCGGGIRECIVPAPGHVFVIVDYVMLEMVILAQALMRQFGYKSNLAELINTGGDIHRKVAAMIFNKDEANITGEERNYAKVLNFGIPGGLGATNLAKNARDFGLEWDDAESKQMRERWLDIFPEVKAFLNGYSQNPEGVWTGTGRYRKTSKYTELRNTVFQGLGADGMNLALKRLWLGGYRIVAVIHDEVLIEVAECEDYTEVVADIERLMIEGMQQIAPDMLIRVESAVSTCWSKKAVKTYDEDGRLVAWSPDTSLDISCPMERTGTATV